jgi:hypothetical protein
MEKGKKKKYEGVYLMIDRDSAPNNKGKGKIARIGLLTITPSNTEDMYVAEIKVINGEYPHNSGYIKDMLHFDGLAKAYIGVDFEVDLSCQITLRFRPNNIEVRQFSLKNNFFCGFGHGVIADGLYKKIKVENFGKKIGKKFL